jgi:hypothetical protein
MKNEFKTFLHAVIYTVIFSISIFILNYTIVVLKIESVFLISAFLALVIGVPASWFLTKIITGCDVFYFRSWRFNL